MPPSARSSAFGLRAGCSPKSSLRSSGGTRREDRLARRRGRYRALVLVPASAILSTNLGMPSKSPIDVVDSLAGAASRKARIERAVAARAIAAAVKLSGYQRHVRVLRAAQALADAATMEIARCLHSQRDCSPHLLTWSTMTLARNAMSVLRPFSVEIAYPLGIHYLVSDRDGIARARALATWTLADGRCVDTESADVLSFIRDADVWPAAYSRSPRSSYSTLARGIRERRDELVADAVAQAALSYERGGTGALRGLSPLSWIPLPLLLAREECKQLDVVWCDPGARSWSMWRTFSPTRHVAVMSSMEHQVLELVASMRSYILEKRASTSRQQSRLGEKDEQRLSQVALDIADAIGAILPQPKRRSGGRRSR